MPVAFTYGFPSRPECFGSNYCQTTGVSEHLTTPADNFIWRGSVTLPLWRKPMANESKKCAHLPCSCMAPAGEKYCSQFCKEAGGAETEIACDCGHPPCSK